MLIRDLFEKEVTRAIPPVVYFHEQAPAELEREVSEYIITGGYPKNDPRAVEGGIHEQFVRLLTAMKQEFEKTGGPELPACWISGFYGSGKSSFAKLLGLALDGRTLPNGKPLAEALIEQDHSLDAGMFRLAWQKLVSGLRPMAVVFDVGSKARDDEHIHAVVVREVQRRLGYSSTSNLVAEYELKLEVEKLYAAFLDKLQAVHGKPWSSLKDHQLVEDYFSAALHALQPDLYPDKLAWVDSRSGSRFENKRSADEAVSAIQSMVRERCPGCTLFLVVDEVSQYVHDDDDRMLALQSFLAALGQRMKGGAWLLATGQQKLEESAGQTTAIVKLKDRFPPALRVHLGVANIRDVVHKRLLRKKKVSRSRPQRALRAPSAGSGAACVQRGRALRDRLHRGLSAAPRSHWALARHHLRLRSRRVQGDSHAIRGLLQLLGDLFREKRLADYEVGRLISVDMIYDVLHSALDADVQMTLARGLEIAAREDDKLIARVVKGVAMLELAQDTLKKVSTELVARCLYTELGQGNQQAEIQRALDTLVGESILAYSEQAGYKIESSAGQEWQRERDGYVPGPEQQTKVIQESLATLLADVPKPKLEDTDLPWLGLFSDNYGSKDVRLRDERKYTVVTVDFQFQKGDGRDAWIALSDSSTHRDRILWVTGDLDGPREVARKLLRSAKMVELHGPRQSTYADDRQRLLMEERNRTEALRKELASVVRAAFLAGQLYFRGRPTSPKDLGTNFAQALAAFGNRVASDLYPHPATFAVAEKDILYLIENAELAAPHPCSGRIGWAF